MYFNFIRYLFILQLVAVSSCISFNYCKYALMTQIQLFSVNVNYCGLACTQYNRLLSDYLLNDDVETCNYWCQRIEENQDYSTNADFYDCADNIYEGFMKMINSTIWMIVTPGNYYNGKDFATNCNCENFGFNNLI